MNSETEKSNVKKAKAERRELRLSVCSSAIGESTWSVRKKPSMIHGAE